MYRQLLKITLKTPPGARCERGRQRDLSLMQFQSIGSKGELIPSRISIDLWQREEQVRQGDASCAVVLVP